LFGVKGNLIIQFGFEHPEVAVTCPPTSDATGIFFHQQTADSLREAVAWFEDNRKKIDARACQRNAKRFSPQRFTQEFKELVEAKWADFEAKRQR
jgi:hypothetical protein